jgi:hypothetical protein
MKRLLAIALIAFSVPAFAEDAAPSYQALLTPLL